MHAVQEGTPAQQLLDLAQRAQQAQQAGQPLPTLTLTLSRRVPLEGEELQEYLAAQQAQQEALALEAQAGEGEALAGESPRAAAAAIATR